MIRRERALIDVALCIRVRPVGDEHRRVARRAEMAPTFGHCRCGLEVAWLGGVRDAVEAAVDVGPLARGTVEALRYWGVVVWRVVWRFFVFFFKK